MAEIKIKVDIDRKAIIGVEVPKELNPVVLSLIFNQLAVRTLAGIQLEPASNIIKPKMKVFNGASKSIGG
jgi:hypothetical protein